MAFQFDEPAIELIDRVEEIPVQLGIARDLSVLRAIGVFFEPSASSWQSDYVLRVGVDEEPASLGLNRIEGPQEGLQFELRGRGIVELLDLDWEIRRFG